MEDALQTSDVSLRERARKLGHLVPWVNLALGVAAAALMERTPGRAAFVAGCALAGWLVVVGAAVLRRIEDRPGHRGRLLAAARWSAVALSGTFLQQSLFFSIPFYVRASTLSPPHVVFVAVLIAVALASLWDPLIERVLAHPGSAVPVQALGTFAGLAVVLPILGLSNVAGLIGGAIGAALGAPLFASVIPGPRPRKLLAVGAAAIPALLLLAPVRAMVPAAPLHLAGGAMGTRLEGREVADPALVIEGTPVQLACATAIDAPRGLHDRIVHVWRHDGALVDRIPVEMRGGREEGFRTYSVKRNLGDAAGVWSCSVETQAGQRLGTLRVAIHAPKS